MYYEFEDEFYEDDEYDDNMYSSNVLDIYNYCEGTFIEGNAVYCIDYFIANNKVKHVDVTGDIIVNFANNFNITFRFHDDEAKSLFYRDFKDNVLDNINGIYGEYHLDIARWQPTVKEGLLTRMFIDGVIENYGVCNDYLTPNLNIYKYLGDYLTDVKDKYKIREETLYKYDVICDYLDYCKDNYKIYDELTKIENQEFNFLKYYEGVLDGNLSRSSSKNVNRFNELKEKIENSKEYIM